MIEDPMIHIDEKDVIFVRMAEEFYQSFHDIYKKYAHHQVPAGMLIGGWMDPLAHLLVSLPIKKEDFLHLCGLVYDNAERKKG